VYIFEPPPSPTGKGKNISRIILAKIYEKAEEKKGGKREAKRRKDRKKKKKKLKG
jgi:hypothetical protein